MIYGVNDAKIILLKFVFIEAVLIPAFPGTEIVSIITFPILRILLFPSVLELIKFSTVENLSRFEEYIFDIPNLTYGRITKTAGLVTLTIDSGKVFTGKSYGDIVLNIPEKFRPKKTVYISASYFQSDKSGAFALKPNGDLIKSHTGDNPTAYYFSVTYPID